MDYTIRAGGLFGVDDLLREFNIAPETVFSKAGLSIEVMENPDERICFLKFLNLLNIAAEDSKCDDFGLLLSPIQGFRMLGAVGFAMKEAPDLRSAVIDLCDFFRVHSNAATPTLQEEDGLAIWSYATIVPSAPDYRQKINLSLGIATGLIRRLLGGHWNPEFVHLEYRQPANTTMLKKTFKCPISFNQEINAIMFDAKFLDQKINSSNDHLYHILRDYLEQNSEATANDFISAVRSKIINDLQKGCCSIDSVAQEFSMKRRTFQRRLSQDGLVFSNVLEQTRMDMAKRYLHLSDISLTQVADMLGYSELAAFSRSFKRNTGKTPRQWRVEAV